MPEPMEPKPTTLIIVRHGQTIWNAQGRWQGWQDSPLTDLGIAQANEAAAELRALINEGLESGVSDRTPEQIREAVLAEMGLTELAKG